MSESLGGRALLPYKMLKWPVKTKRLEVKLLEDYFLFFLNLFILFFLNLINF
jgi:hypothetical protein